MMYSTIADQLKKRFAGSVMGLAWLVVYPILFLSMYSTVYVLILHVRLPQLSTVDYVLMIFCGLVPFLAFAESFGTGVGSIVANASLVKNTMFPVELVVLSNVLSGHAVMGIGMILVWIAVVANGHLYLSDLFVPVIFLLQIILVSGIVWFFSTINVFIRDVAQAIPIIVLFLMLVSPIAYTANMVPKSIKWLVFLNPLASLMDLYREALMKGRVAWLEFFCLLIFSSIVFFGGYLFLRRLKPLFSDYV